MSEISYPLNYREDGKKKTVDIKVDWTSNNTDRSQRQMVEEATKIKALFEKAKTILENRALCLVDGKNKAKGWKDRLLVFDKEQKDNETAIREYDNKDFYQERYNLVETILKDNNCPHKFLFDFDFWDNKVNPTEMVKFLHYAVNREEFKAVSGGSEKK